MALRNQEIGARLRELRGQRPQTVVADGLGVAERTYQNWEAGDAKPSYRNLQRIAEYFGVSENYVLTGEGAGSPSEPAATPDPFPATALEGVLGDVLREIKDQLAEQTRVLDEIKVYAREVKAMLEEQRDIKEETDEVAEMIRRAGREIVQPSTDGSDPQPTPEPRAASPKKRAAKSRTPSRP